ncbi:RAD52 DNA repair protein RADC [Taphrina deformans PYCC 5710]|uniref:RAD52 DNA repair protein RADC n=1 Tax=Taphrina deformans (strain PYCC 5710 / ATCC 11124 / CBS 356.35 / IMI 108563 / JCM 9778 / NBRC 8474) TaxID=1097556 RepID=R4XAG9_TAPDE|nr:RAD52 DNA repair protein RADC [Taphrina deformans PYCC 5710]|eukprot:CCG82502.1 RAD52 DNA repair protein RADC [Taphrina deformans PYCC 5710]
MRDGDQHMETKLTKNPFVSDPVNGYTAAEIATLQARLDKQLGPEYISHRSNGASGKVSYLEAFKVINLANEVFGFNGWSSEVRNVSVDFLDEKGDHRYSLGLSVTVRVTLRDGTFHEDIGYGNIENCRGKGAAFEKCKKEGTTDAMKRALRNFGNVLGNCLYDKTFLSNIAKVKVPSTKFDPDLLHRRPEFALPPDHPKMQMHRNNQMPPPAMSRRSSEVPDRTIVRQDSLRSDTDNYGDDIFDNLEFDEDRPGNYDEVTMDDSMVQSPEHGTSNLSALRSNNSDHQYMPPSPRQMTMTQTEAKRLHALRQAEKDKNTPTHEALPVQNNRPPPPVFEGESIHAAIDGAAEPPPNYQPSFMNSRTLVLPTAAPVPFDPKISSPSIPKSGLADHTRSTPIKRPGAGSNSVVESPIAGNASPLRRMGNAITGSVAPMMRTGSTQFRAPSKLNQTVPDNNTAKRTSEALAEHPQGAIAMNERVLAVGAGGSAEKKIKS